MQAKELQSDFSAPFVWEPSSDDIERSRLTEFMRAQGISEFSELMQKSTENVSWFTEAILNFLDIQFYEPYTEIMDLAGGSAFPNWCVDGKMNIVHNCLDKYLGTEQEKQIAVQYESEAGHVRSMTYKQLNSEVCKATNAIRKLGLGKGDAIGIFMPMVPEIVVALLAIAKIGAVILPLFSGYGVEAIAGRLKDGKAKALFCADSAPRRGKMHSMKSIADKAADQVPSLKHMIVVQNQDKAVKMRDGRDHYWQDLMMDNSPEAETEKTDAEDPLMIIYTSGTTGKPKGALHTHVGFPVKAAQDMAFGTDVHAGERIYWMTDMGWMMGPWLVFGALLLGASLFIYDGAPDYPGPDRLWKMVAEHEINMLGISPL